MYMKLRAHGIELGFLAEDERFRTSGLGFADLPIKTAQVSVDIAPGCHAQIKQGTG